MLLVFYSFPINCQKPFFCLRKLYKESHLAQGFFCFVLFFTACDVIWLYFTCQHSFHSSRHQALRSLGKKKLRKKWQRYTTFELRLPFPLVIFTGQNLLGLAWKFSYKDLPLDIHNVEENSTEQSHIYLNFHGSFKWSHATHIPTLEGCYSSIHWRNQWQIQRCLRLHRSTTGTLNISSTSSHHNWEKTDTARQIVPQLSTRIRGMRKSHYGKEVKCSSLSCRLFPTENLT